MGRKAVMTSLWRGLGATLVIIATMQVGASAASQPGTPQALPPRSSAPPAPAPQYAPPAPASIRDRVNDLGRQFNGRVGIAVRSVNEGWTVGWKADDYYPQQSVSKFWVSLAALDAVDKGR